MPAWGVTSAGFAVKPLANILADMQAQALATINSQLDLSPGTPDGQMLGIVANQAAACWELLQIAYNQFNRQDVEGAGLDNLGDLTGTPRAGPTYTQVLATLTISAANAPYAPGTLVANVSGQSSQTFANLYTVTAAQISGGVAAGVMFQATTLGPTPAVNAGTLTVITTPVTGWTAVTNPAGQSQLGTASELDAAYAVRQSLDLAASGGSNPNALAEALVQLGEAQNPPVTLTVQVVENVLPFYQVVNGIGLLPRTFCVVIYDGTPTGTWALGAGQSLIASTIYAQKPAGIASSGSVAATVIDPVLGPQTVFYSTPTALTLYVSTAVIARVGVSHAALVPAVQAALVAAAVAPTPANGLPSPGQLVPGASVYGSQLEAVIAAVPGVLKVSALTFAFSPSPVNTADLAVGANQIATIAAVNVVVT